MNQQLEAREALSAVIARIIREAVPTTGQCLLYESDEAAHDYAHPIHTISWYPGHDRHQRIEHLVVDDVDGLARLIADGFMGVSTLENYEAAA